MPMTICLTMRRCFSWPQDHSPYIQLFDGLDNALTCEIAPPIHTPKNNESLRSMSGVPACTKPNWVESRVENKPGRDGSEGTDVKWDSGVRVHRIEGNTKDGSNCEDKVTFIQSSSSMTVDQHASHIHPPTSPSTLPSQIVTTCHLTVHVICAMPQHWIVYPLHRYSNMRPWHHTCGNAYRDGSTGSQQVLMDEI